MSSNLISRSTVNAFTKSFLLQLILDTRIGYLGSFFDILRKFSPYTTLPYYEYRVRSSGDVDHNGFSGGDNSYGYAGHG